MRRARDLRSAASEEAARAQAAVLGSVPRSRSRPGLDRQAGCSARSPRTRSPKRWRHRRASRSTTRRSGSRSRSSRLAPSRFRSTSYRRRVSAGRGGGHCGRLSPAQQGPRHTRPSPFEGDQRDPSSPQGGSSPHPQLATRGPPPVHRRRLTGITRGFVVRIPRFRVFRPTAGPVRVMGTMVQALDDTRPRPIRPDRDAPGPPAQPRGRGVGPRRDAPVQRRDRGRHRDLRRRGLLQAGPRAHLRGDHRPLRAGRADRRGHGARRADPIGPHRIGWGPGRPRLAPGQHAVDRECGALRPHRRGARPAPPHDRSGRRNRRHRLQRPRGRGGRGRRDGSEGLQRRPTTHYREHQVPPRRAVAEPRPDRGAVARARRGHRRRHRLHRPGRHPGRAPALHPHDRRRPPRRRQDQPGPRYPRPRRDRAA